MEAMITLLQMGIWIVVTIMIAFVALYIYLMKPRNTSGYNSTTDKFSKEYEEYNDLNSQQEDDGPIQNL